MFSNLGRIISFKERTEFSQLVLTHSLTSEEKDHGIIFMVGGTDHLQKFNTVLVNIGPYLFFM